MNTRNSLAKNGFKVALLFAIAFTATNCSKDDDAPTVNVEEEFEKVPDMPELVIEEPEVSEPDLGGVEQSEETKSLISDLEDGQASAETEQKIQSVASFSATLSDAFKQEAANLDENRVSEILNAESLDSDLAEAEAALANAPDDVKALMPKINFSADFNLASYTPSKTGWVDSKEEYAQSSNECAQAQAAYDSKVNKAKQTRDAQLAEINTYETNAKAAANTRSQTRSGNVDEAKATYKEAALAVANDLLAYAATVTDADRKATIQSLALLYTVKASAAINTWVTASNGLIADRLELELDTIDVLVASLKVEVNDAFQEIKDAAAKILNDVCHNQGGGN